MKRCAFLAFSGLLWSLLSPGASATLLSDVLAGGPPLNGQIIQGNLKFNSFSYSLGSVASTTIDVVGFTSATGDFGLRFTASPAFQITPSGGSKDFIFDLFFNVTVMDSALINGFRQSFDASGMSGNTIMALDSTVDGLVAASNCVVPSGSPLCGFSPHTNSATVAPTNFILQLDRQVQLVADRGVPDTGTINTWDVTFSQVPGAPGPAPIPEPATELLLGGGLAALAVVSARRGSRGSRR